MKAHIAILIGFGFIFHLFPLPAGAQRTSPLLIDHRCTNISAVPAQWIAQARSAFRIHYAHTSHGGQITAGLQRMQTSIPACAVEIGSSELPPASSSLRIFDGQEGETYITPDLYWSTPEGIQRTNDVLAHNPSINLSLWCWCTQQDGNDSATTAQYLSAMSALEAAHPAVTFVYMTGNAQTVETNRQERNRQVRNFCIANNKILFDFEDLDCWYNGQQNVESGIPCEHPRYHGDEEAHTTYESCENKARAFWWMLARLAGWDGAPPAAESVRELAAFHRSGQTFLTWRERGDLSGESYNVYRHTAPITAANLGAATRVAAMPEGSAIYKIERWKFENGFTPVQQNFIVNDLGAELSDTQGLCVYTLQPGEGGTGYYAVTSVSGGTEDRTISPGNNALTAGVAETPATPAPVLVWQSTNGKGRIYTQFMDIRNWNPTNTGYAYNYFVSLPDQYDPGQPYPLYLHIEGHGSRYSHEDSLATPFEIPAIQIWGDDPHQSWYYGFSKSFNYGDSWPQHTGSDLAQAASGPVSNFTEQRLLRAIDEVRRNPLYNVDTNRVYVYGHSMGASGSLALAMRYPRIFAAAFCNEPMTNYAGDDPNVDANWFNDLEPKWGALAANFPIVNEGPFAAHLAPYDGRPVWNWMNHRQNMLERQKDEMAYIVTFHGTADNVIEWATQGRPWYVTMSTSARRGWCGFVMNIDHTWLGFFDTPNFSLPAFSFRKDRSFPAFTNFSLNLDQANSTSYYNIGLEWSCPWNDFSGDITDNQSLYEIAFRLYDPALEGYQTLPDSGNVDITPRRLQNFRVIAGQVYSWENVQLSDSRVIQRGSVTPDTAGLLTIGNFQVTKSGNRLRLFPYGGTAVQPPAESSVMLYQNSPNPFRDRTTIGYRLAKEGKIDLAVFDMLGRMVRTLAQGDHIPGSHSVLWDGRDEFGKMVSSGMYLCRLAGDGGIVAVRRMALVRQ